MATKKRLAIDLFHRGQRVKLVASEPKKWRTYGLVGATGVVVGFSRNKEFVSVRLDGQKYHSLYSPSFWEPAEKGRDHE